MENLKNNRETRKGFLQGWGFIILILAIVIVGMVGLKVIMS